MGRLYISAKNQISGPWLLSHENLGTLNDLFNEIDDLLSKALVRTIETLAKQQMEDEIQAIDLPKKVAIIRRKYSNKSKSAILTFSDGSTFEASDIQELIHHVNSIPSLSLKELYIRTIQGNHENEFNLIINSKPNKEEPDFEYRIRCLDFQIQLEIKTLIDKWIRDNKPPELLQLWSNHLVPVNWVIGILALIISLSNLETTVSKAEKYKEELKQVAQKMIENKDPLFNHDSALFLLLKLESDYVPENIKSENIVVQNKGAKKIFVISIAFLLISLFRPRTILGIGKEFIWLRIFSFWWKFVIIGGISLLVTSLIADAFLNFINW